MAETISKKLKRLKKTLRKSRIKLIELSVKQAFMTTLSYQQQASLKAQIDKLSNKVRLYERKIKELEAELLEKR